MKYPPILRNKQVQIALGATVGILILTIIIAPHPSINPESTPLPSSYRPELQALTTNQRIQSSNYRSTITQHLPIYLANYTTSANISTTLHIYVQKEDPPDVVRFEIYGISYLNPNSTEFTNPNISAYRETFRRGIQLLERAGVDPTQLTFIYGDRAYVRDAAAAWVDKYNLLK